MGPTAKFLGILHKGRFAVLGCFLILAGLAAWQAPLVISRSVTTFNPPKGSLARQGNAELSQAFPGRGILATFALFVEKTVISGEESDEIWLDRFGNFSRSVNASLSDLRVVQCGTPCVLQVAGYWTLRDMGLPEQSYAQFLSKNENASFFEIAINVPFFSRSAIEWAKEAQLIINAAAETYLPNSRATLLGVPSFIPTMLSDIELDLGLMVRIIRFSLLIILNSFSTLFKDGIVIPLAFLIFLLMVKSVRLLLIPILSMILSLSFTFGSTAVLTYFVPVMSFIPSLLMSLTIALSFDYSLFIAVRMREELINKNTSGDDFGCSENEWFQVVLKVVQTRSVFRN